MRDSLSLHFRLDAESQKILKILTDDLSCSRGEVGRRAIKVFNRIYKAILQGNTVIIVDKQTKKETAILLV